VENGKLGQRMALDKLLNMAQRNRILTVLRTLELDLVEAQAALDGVQQEGILFRAELNLPEEHRAAIAAEIEAALSEIAGLARDFRLPATQQNVASKIAAALSVDWADLTDSISGTLGRYGPVDPGLGEVLDARVERLSERALAIASQMRQGGRA
jgi:hypothetical protein